MADIVPAPQVDLVNPFSNQVSALQQVAQQRQKAISTTRTSAQSIAASRETLLETAAKEHGRVQAGLQDIQTGLAGHEEMNKSIFATIDPTGGIVGAFRRAERSKLDNLIQRGENTIEQSKLSLSAAETQHRITSEAAAQAAGAEQDILGLQRGAVSDAQSAASLVETQLRVNAVQQEQLLSSLGENELNAMMSGQAPIPEGLSVGQIEAQNQKNINRRIQTQSARLALEQGNFDFLKDIKAELLTTTLNNEELAAGLEEAANTGTATLDGVEFSFNELEVAAQERALSMQERQNKLSTSAIAASGLAFSETQMRSKADNFHSVLKPGTPTDPENPLGAYPIPVQTELARLERQKATAIETGNFEAAAAAQEAQSAIQNQVEETFIKAQPKSTQPAMQQYLTTGTVASEENASDYLFSSASNPNIMSYDPVADPVWRAFTAQLNTERDSAQEALTLESLVAGQQQKKLPTNVVVQQAVKNSEVFNIAQNTYGVELARIGIEQLIGSGIVPEELWTDIYDPNTREFAPFIQPAQEDGSPVFSVQNLSQALANKTIALQSAGKLGASGSMGALLVRAMQTNQLSIRDMMNSDINMATLHQSMYAGRGEIAAQGMLEGLARQIPMATQESQLLKQDLARKAQVAADMAEMELQEPLVPGTTIPAIGGGASGAAAVVQPSGGAQQNLFNSLMSAGQSVFGVSQ